jgi:guanylate kinase
VSKPGGPSGIAFVVSGPSGAGKTTLLRLVLERDEGLRFSVSHTTRAPRPGEVEGVDYHFVSREEFKKLIEAEAFLEHAEYQGNLYGTSRLAVEEMLAAGLDVVLEVEVKGARQLREQLPDAVSVIVLPPSFESLGKRLRLRASDSEEAIRRRLDIAREEIREAPGYSYVIVNSNLEAAVEDLQGIIQVARLRPERVLPGWWNGDSE